MGVTSVSVRHGAVRAILIVAAALLFAACEPNPNPNAVPRVPTPTPEPNREPKPASPKTLEFSMDGNDPADLSHCAQLDSRRYA